MRPLTPGKRMQRSGVGGVAQSDAVSEWIKPNRQLTSFDRLEIYNRGYWFRVLDCFFEDYPGLRAVLGERRFSRLAMAYLSAHPSHSFTLRNLGCCLVDFIAARPAFTGDLQDLCLDMARLEWAHIEAFDKESRPALGLDDLLDIPAAKLRLRLQPFVVLLKLGFPLDDFLIEVKNHAGLRSEASNAVQEPPHSPPRKQKRPKPSLTYLAVHRQDFTVYYKRLEQGQFALLTALQRGASLGKAIDALAKEESGLSLDPQTIGRWFETWSALGWFGR